MQKKLVTLISWFFTCWFLVHAQTHPNILYIMGDDHAWNAVGAYNSRFKDYVMTPTIDKLADEGALFLNCVCTNSLCSPSRASIITGKYSHKNGVYTLREYLNADSIPTLAKLFHAGGYQTAVVGKWHIHGDNLQGYDYYAVTFSQGSYLNPSLTTKEGKIKKEGHSTTVYTDLALDWLKNRNKNKPFLLMTHYKATHGPWLYNKKYKDLYKNDTITEPSNLFDKYDNRDPNGVPMKRSKIYQPDSKMALSYWVQYGKKGKGKWPTGNLNFDGLSATEQTKLTYQKYLKDYLRCVKGIDDGVKRLIDYLKAEDILDNTVIIYTSDQGMFLGEHGFFDKRLGLEEGMKMPFIIRYPKKIKPGTVITEMINEVDFAPTLLDFAGLKIPAEFQGISFMNLVEGQVPDRKREVSFYQFYSSSTPTHYGIRTNRYKLLKYTGKDGTVLGTDLYDLQMDPHEMKNVYMDPGYKKVRDQMEQKLIDEMKRIDIKDGYLPGQSEWKKHVIVHKKGGKKIKKPKNF